jgi:cytochrome c-type biogenesis protein CcmF
MLLVVTFSGSIGILPMLGMIVAAGVAAASIAPLWKRNLKRTPLFTYGMVIAHLGCAVSMAGMAADSAFMKETLVSMKIGETRSVGPYNVQLKGVSEVPGPNWSALDAELVVQKGVDTPFTVHPQSRTFTDPPMETSESAITTAWNGQLYLVVGAPTDPVSFPIRMWWKPFVTFIWLGGAMIAFGGLLSLLGRVDRDLFAWRKWLLRRAVEV